MARKTNKTAHVLNLLANGSPNAPEQEANSSVFAPNISIVNNSTNPADPLAGLIRNTLDREILHNGENIGDVPSVVEPISVAVTAPEPTATPTPEPTAPPTPEPTAPPTPEPTATPTPEPTTPPTPEPTTTPTPEPTATPTPEPTATPTPEPTATPTPEPTATPTPEPTATPTPEPTTTPTPEPTTTPTPEPTATPTPEPTATPTPEPTATPTPEPTTPPTPEPTTTPTPEPTTTSTPEPTATPTPNPTAVTTAEPSAPTVIQAPIMAAEIAKEPVSAPSEKEPEIEVNYLSLNMMDFLLEERLMEFLHRFDTCTCQRCIMDAKALALTNLPPKYLVLPKNSIAPLTSFYRNKYSIYIVTELTKACLAIINNPRH